MQNEFLINLCNCAQNIIIFCDLQGNILYTNKAFTTHYDWKQEEILNKNFNILLEESDKKTFQNQIQQLLFHEIEIKFESFRNTKSGKKIMISSSLSRVYDESGKIIGISALESIIPEQIRVKNLSQELLEKAPDAIIVANHAGQIVLINKQTEKMFGYLREELLGNQIEILLPDHLSKIHVEHRDNFFKHPKTREMGEGKDLFAKKKDASIFPVEISLSPVSFDGFTYVSAAIRDISVRKNMQKELKINELRFRSVTENALDSIITFNKDLEVLTYNLASEKMFGFSNEKIVGKKIDRLFVNLDLKDLLREHDSESKLKGFQKLIVCKRADDFEFPAEISMSQMSIEGDSIFILITRDVTEREKLDKLKKEFVSTVNHELRTPLTSIKGSLSLILGGKCGQMNEQALHLLEIAFRNSERLANLINDLLDIEKIESGKMDFGWEKIELSSLIRQVVMINEPYAEKLNVKLCVEDLPPEVYVDGDSNRLIQVFTNLLSNAIKFSPQDETVIIKLELLNRKVRISVKDNGPGIPEEFHSRIFQRFSQLDSSDQKPKGGTGLGLYISKLIVEHLSGKIGVVSTPGEGATFFVELNKSMSRDSSENKPKMLICEDDLDVANMISILLKENDFDCLAVDSAEKAKEELTRENYDALLLDIVLPGESGLSFIESLRQQTQISSVPIILMSGKVYPDNNLLTSTSSFPVIDYLKKPVDFSHLEKLLNELMVLKEKKLLNILYITPKKDILEKLKIDSKKIATIETVDALDDTKLKSQLLNYDLVIWDFENFDKSSMKSFKNFMLLQESRITPIIHYDSKILTEPINDKSMPKERERFVEILKQILKNLKQPLNK